jgi:DNA adenine methylase
MRLIEPFAGGANVSLTAVFENLVDAASLVEMDIDVAAVWSTLLGGKGQELINRVMTFAVTTQSVDALLGTAPNSTVDQALRTIVANRVNHGGILAPGVGRVRAGERGNGLASRWYPRTLARRMSTIVTARERLKFACADGLDLLCAPGSPDDVYFIDPPYTASKRSPGRRMYRHWNLDHERLFASAAGLAGDVLITYDDAPEVRALAARHDFEVLPVAMTGNRNRVRRELVIGRDLSWAR